MDRVDFKLLGTWKSLVTVDFYYTILRILFECFVEQTVM